MDNQWSDTCGPSLDPDSTDPNHQGSYSIQPFQTHSRYFYATLGEECCGDNFIHVYFQQHHPFPHCTDCARMVLGCATNLCWQCRTYFRRYGTGQMQQIMGVTPQRHNVMAIIYPEQGQNQNRLPEEQRAQEWRDNCLDIIRPPILQVLLPQPNQCQFGRRVRTYIDQIQPNMVLARIPFVPMLYFNADALLPLPRSYRIYRHGLTLTQEEIVINQRDDDEEQAPPPAPGP